MFQQKNKKETTNEKNTSAHIHLLETPSQSSKNILSVWNFVELSRVWFTQFVDPSATTKVKRATSSFSKSTTSPWMSPWWANHEAPTRSNSENKRSWTKSSAYIVFAETWRKFGKTNTLHRRYVIHSCSLITIDKKRNCFEGKTKTCMSFCQRRWRHFTTPSPSWCPYHRDWKISEKHVECQIAWGLQIYI